MADDVYCVADVIGVFDIVAIWNLFDTYFHLFTCQDILITFFKASSFNLGPHVNTVQLSSHCVDPSAGNQNIKLFSCLPCGYLRC